MSHLLSIRLTKPLKDVGDIKNSNLAEEITENCSTSIKSRNISFKFFVSLSMYRDFKDAVSLNVKIWDSKKPIYTLHK